MASAIPDTATGTRFYRSLLLVEVLSDRPDVTAGQDLAVLAREITTGGSSSPATTPTSTAIPKASPPWHGPARFAGSAAMRPLAGEACRREARAG